jgi:exodeoxyribonuclease V beta subunit
VTADQLRQLVALAQPCPSMLAAQAPAPTNARFSGADQAVERGSALVPVRAARENWWIASYSSLRTVAADAAIPASAALPGHPSAPMRVPDTPREAIFHEERLGRPGSTRAIARRAAPRAQHPAFPRRAGPSCTI